MKIRDTLPIVLIILGIIFFVIFVFMGTQTLYTPEWGIGLWLGAAGIFLTGVITLYMNDPIEEGDECIEE